MASWIIHLRAAQQLYQKLQIKPTDAFVLGNIAPDSGVPTADGSGFVPDAEISHFRSLDENGIKNIHEDRFIARYFTPEQRQSYSDQEYAFFLGYLTHLLTDKIWAEKIVYAAKEQQSALFASDRALFWQTIKRDWYDMDFMYLKANPDFEAFRVYRDNPDVRNTYLDFFSETAFEERRHFILDFYTNGAANVVWRDTYLSMEELIVLLRPQLTKSRIISNVCDFELSISALSQLCPPLPADCIRAEHNATDQQCKRQYDFHATESPYWRILPQLPEIKGTVHQPASRHGAQDDKQRQRL